jgi:hypothetical protein
MDFHRFHRYDFAQKAMAAPDQTWPTRDAIEMARATLASGNTVYLGGQPMLPDDTSAVRVLPPAPDASGRWDEGAYQKEWSSMLGVFLRKHAVTIEPVSLIRPSSSPEHISGYETLTLLAAHGLR